MDTKEFIARKVASFFREGDVINLGIGIPDMASTYMVENVWIQTENGLLGAGPIAHPGLRKTGSFCNATGTDVEPVMGACTFDVATSFAMFRTGRIDASVLGCIQVAANGDLANWSLPGRQPGMGGAMDIVNGIKRIIVATTHCAKDGSSKIVSECTAPLTGKGVVDYIVTEYAYFAIRDEKLVLLELRRDMTVEKLAEITDAPFTVADDLKTYVIPGMEDVLPEA